MDVEIKNCNNIDYGKITIKAHKINIKYAINGTGKTTIAKAIENKIKNSNIEELKPFKTLGNKEINPEINGLENIKKIKIFNEEYVNQFVFLESETVKNSFNIFIRNDKYDREMAEINNLLNEIKTTFVEDLDIKELLHNLKALSQSFGKTKTGYAANSTIGKALGNGNKLENIPEGLEDFSDFLKSDLNTKWLKWQMTGKEYLEITDKCPYCTSKEISKNKIKIKKLTTEYNSNIIDHLNNILEVFNKLNIYFSEDVKGKIESITKNINGISEEQHLFLIQIKNQIDLLISKLEKMENINYISLKDSDKIVTIINDYKIDIRYLEHLNSKEMNEKILVLNQKLDNILKKANNLKGNINKQNKNIKDSIEKYESEINNFLQCSGIKYNVGIQLDNDEIYRMKLRHNDLHENLKNPTTHLSYGEKNAFALILFMYEVLKEEIDLIVLDDPISSFDRNKKFAIINTLFRGKNSFMNKTVLMLTHDFEPIIDMKYVLSNIFPCDVMFLENKKGILVEKKIEKADIHTFIEIAEKNIKFVTNNINKLVYLRRYYEIKDKENIVYDLISSLLHKREKPTKKDIETLLTNTEIKEAEKIVTEFIPKFNYQNEYNKIIDTQELIKTYEASTNNYEKLQIYRVIFDNSEIKDDVIRKFLNETFHIENEYLFQLNPCDYEIVPEFIIEQCDVDINKLKN